MKRLVRVGLVIVLALGIGGCITSQQREEAVEKAAVEAQKAAETKTYSEAVGRGIPEEQAKEMARSAGELAYTSVKEAAKKIPSEGGLGKVLTGLLYALVQFGLPMLAKRGEA